MRIALSLVLASVLCCGAQYLQHRREAFRPSGGGAVVDSPDDLSGLFAWFKSDALVTNTAGNLTQTGGDQIKTWGDSSGNGHYLFTNNPSYAPQFDSSATTGKSYGGLEFGTSEHMETAFAALPNTTIFLVWRVASLGTYVLAIDSTNSSNRQILYKHSNNSMRITSGTDITGGTTGNGVWWIMCGVFNSSGNDSFYTNGVLVATADAGNQSLAGFTVGSGYDGNSITGNDSWVGEIIIYNRNLNSTEVGQIFSYLNTRWAVY